MTQRPKQPKHIQKPPGVAHVKLQLAPNWSALQCKTLNEGLDDHVPPTWGRMRAQYPLPHGPTCSCYITSTLVFLVGSDPAEMQEVIDRVAATLQAASFIVSQNSTLHPIQTIFWGVSGWTLRIGRLGRTNGLSLRRSMRG